MKEKKKAGVRGQGSLRNNPETWGQCSSSPRGALLCFQTCVQAFNETPLQLLEKIKNVFNETKNLLKKDHNIFSKNCSDSFAKCSHQSKHRRSQKVWGRGGCVGESRDWEVRQAGGNPGMQPGCYSCSCVCDVLVSCTYVAPCTSGWS